jgi:Kef-type K+ transport system membrane component KefB
MRRALILMLLLWGMSVIEPFGRAAPASLALLTFGFLILAAYTVGEIARGMRLPMLVGYMLAGVLFGPYVLRIVTIDAMNHVSSLNQLAISLIALMAGAELDMAVVRRDGMRYLKILVVEVALTFAACLATIFALRAYIPSIAHSNTLTVLVFAMLFCSIVVAHSPAATLGILTETKAQGPTARTALGVVLLSDVLLIVLFTLVATTARFLLPPTGADTAGLGAVLWEVVGAVIVGGGIGGIVALYLRFTERDLLLFGLIIALLGGEIARLAHVEVLLTLLVAGFIACNVAATERGNELRHAIERAAAPFFVVFFALAGASIPITEVVAVITIVTPIAIVRCLTIWGGTALGSRWAGMPASETKHLWMALVAQAGVAIGFASIAAQVYPDLGPGIRTLALSVIAINQLLGPILFRRALTRAGEVQQDDGGRS